MEYRTGNKMLYSWQSGFRENCWTNAGLLYFVEEILIVLGFDLLFGMVLIDLQKAHDAMNHEILLKSYFNWIFTELIAWFEPYFANKKFQVSIKNKFSNFLKNNCGVPKKPIIGHLLFLL